MGHGKDRSQRERRKMTQEEKANRATDKAQKEKDMRSTGTARMQQALAGTLAGRLVMFAASCCSPVQCKWPDIQLGPSQADPGLQCRHCAGFFHADCAKAAADPQFEDLSWCGCATGKAALAAAAASAAEATSAAAADEAAAEQAEFFKRQTWQADDIEAELDNKSDVHMRAR